MGVFYCKNPVELEYNGLLLYRKLEEDHKEKLSMVRSELMKEMDQIQQQSGLQREELEAELEKIREDESFLRDHLSISVKVKKKTPTTVGTESVQTPLKFSLFVSLQPFAKIKKVHFISH